MHEIFMKEALEEAKKAYLLDEVPIGAVAVVEGEIVARSFNLKEKGNNPTYHAEILLIHQLAELYGDWRLTNVTVYVTVEPCLMCVGALVQARIPRLVFGARDPKFGAVRSLYEGADDKRSNHRMEVIEGILAEEATGLMKDFFKEKR